MRQGFSALLFGAVGNGSHRRGGHRSAHLTKGGLYGSHRRSLQANHLVAPPWEACRGRMAAYLRGPANRPAAAHRAVVAQGDSTAKKATAVMTTRLGAVLLRASV